MGLQTNVKVSVVITTYNRSEMLRKALKTLICQKTNGKFSYEVIVVDNASTDSTKAVVQQIVINSPVSVRYVQERVQGVAYARNKGVKESRGEWIAFFDDDQLADPNWLKELYNAALKTRAPIVGGAVHLDMSEEQLQSLGPVCRKMLRETQFYRKDAHRYKAKDLPGTGNVFIARIVFDSIGLFDCSLQGGGADFDFALRSRMAGFDMWYTPKAVILHGVSQNRLTPKYLEWDALRCGALLAYLDFKYKGRSKMLFLCVVRIGRILILILPLLFLGWLRRDLGEVLARKGQIWATEGYTRKTLSLIAPAIFRQNRFFDSLKFEKGREIEQGM